MAEDRIAGTVIRVVRDRGFGFLRATASGVEYFFHRSAMVGDPRTFDTITMGTAVQFDAMQGSKGPRAERVEVV